MKYLLDHCVAKPILRHLEGFDVQRAGELGWAELANGRLLAAAEAAGYQALITVDKGFAKQQNMSGRTISVLLLDTLNTSISGLIPLMPTLIAEMKELKPGVVVRIRND